MVLNELRNSKIRPLVQSSFALYLLSVLVVWDVIFVTSDQSRLTSSEQSKHPNRIVGSSPNRHQQHQPWTRISSNFHLESIEDLEHLAYLSMRNYNLTDENLSQASWSLTGNLGNPLLHKQHQKGSSAVVTTDPKEMMALVLESFIAHLRNGHLRRLSLEELEQIGASLNITADGQWPPQPPDIVEAPPDATRENSTTLEIQNERLTGSGEVNDLGLMAELEQQQQQQKQQQQETSQARDRCFYLVGIYKVDLIQRHQQVGAERDIELQMQSHGNVEQQTSTENSRSLQTPTQSQISTSGQEQQQQQQQQMPSVISKELEWRLARLCRLAVECSSADELVALIGGPWRSTASPQVNSATSGEEWAGERQAEPRATRPAKSLRDSLSMSLTKLCPLILFQLHEDEGLCIARRDDRPPTVTVWAFATLFVTIVSFCSLIGLSITPLLGRASDDIPINSLSSDLSDFQAEMKPRDQPQTSKLRPSSAASNNNNNIINNSKQTKHKACLNLFEGLAVGSLAGSALFSLIPQAFELQERESNQGILLKSLIIFCGIYLFFCSERLMRMVLDLRQQRKKRKRLANRSSNSIPLHPSTTTGDFGLGQVCMVAKAAGERNKQAQTSRLVVGEIGSAKLHSLGRKEPFETRSVSFTSRQTRPTGSGGREMSRETRLRRKLPSSSQRNELRRRRRVQSQKLRRQQQSNFAELLPSRRLNSRAKRAVGYISDSHDDEVSICEPRAKLEASAPTGSCSSHGNSLTSSAGGSSSSLSRSHQRQRPSSSDSQVDDTNANMSDQFESSSDEFDGCRFDSQDRHSNDSDGPLQMRPLKTSTCATLRSSLASHKQSQPSSNYHYREHLSHREAFNFRPVPLASEEQSQNKQDISTVAWMIILGDGLHNLIDGISIGAAFSESILSGVSISVAVICEEFPHELGDFAVLVSSGMTVRQALGYNFLSACTCYFGMAVGIILGDVNDGASYISALAAGVFLYIALVDMMGELSATLEEASRHSVAKALKLLLLQNVGIFIGISIIFILSFIDL